MSKKNPLLDAVIQVKDPGGLKRLAKGRGSQAIARSRLSHTLSGHGLSDLKRCVSRAQCSGRCKIHQIH
eukprot:8400253-Pyramimonas_sp.AAC.1